MKILARKYVTNGDKWNSWFTSLSEALEFLQETEENISVKVDWLHYIDIFFKGTNNYLRVNNEKEN